MASNGKNQSFFTSFANRVALLAGTPYAFTAAMGIIIVWGVTGPLFGFSDTWQLVVNTGTTIVTFLMVFLIQNSQNRDNQAIQLKLDELLRVNDQVSDELLDLENLDISELEERRGAYTRRADEARKQMEQARTSSTEPSTDT